MADDHGHGQQQIEVHGEQEADVEQQRQHDRQDLAQNPHLGKGRVGHRIGAYAQPHGGGKMTQPPQAQQRAQRPGKAGQARGHGHRQRGLQERLRFFIIIRPGGLEESAEDEPFGAQRPKLGIA